MAWFSGGTYGGTKRGPPDLEFSSSWDRRGGAADKRVKLEPQLGGGDGGYQTPQSSQGQEAVPLFPYQSFHEGPEQEDQWQQHRQEQQQQQQIYAGGQPQTRTQTQAYHLDLAGHMHGHTFSQPPPQVQGQGRNIHSQYHHITNTVGISSACGNQRLPAPQEKGQFHIKEELPHQWHHQPKPPPIITPLMSELRHRQQSVGEHTQHRQTPNRDGRRQFIHQQQTDKNQQPINRQSPQRRNRELPIGGDSNRQPPHTANREQPWQTPYRDNRQQQPIGVQPPPGRGEGGKLLGDSGRQPLDKRHDDDSQRPLQPFLGEDCHRSSFSASASAVGEPHSRQQFEGQQQKSPPPLMGESRAATRNEGDSRTGRGGAGKSTGNNLVQQQEQQAQDDCNSRTHTRTRTHTLGAGMGSGDDKTSGGGGGSHAGPGPSESNDPATSERKPGLNDLDLHVDPSSLDRGQSKARDEMRDRTEDRGDGLSSGGGGGGGEHQKLLQVPPPEGIMEEDRPSLGGETVSPEGLGKTSKDKDDHEGASTDNMQVRDSTVHNNILLCDKKVLPMSVCVCMHV